MTSKNGPSHVVVDGSNIATEGRSAPSLAQLSDAVTSFMEEHPAAAITVVVDATFGHRIDKREVAEFEAGISNNELVAPPAGAIGRGDAFVLSIAQKANASILSNDSFQEFHADYEWLFDEGRLIGGKPVPHVGWVFVNRSPVRGPVSRKATQGARGGRTRGGSKRTEADRGPVALSSGSPLANEPMPVPKSPPPGRSKNAAPQRTVEAPAASPPPAPRAGDVVNELMPFLEFVEHHPIGTSVNGIVETYSSHGAYISIGTDGVRGYIPLRLMSDPPPTSARKVMQIGEAVTAVVVSFAAARRSIDCALPDMAGHPQATAPPVEAAPARSPRRGRAKMETLVAEAVIEQLGAPLADTAATGQAPARRGSRKRAAAPSDVTVVGEESVANGGITPTTPTTQNAVTKNSAAKRAPAKKAPAKKAPAKQQPAKNAPAKQPPAKKVSAEKVSARKMPAPEPVSTVGTNADVDKAPASRTPASRAPAKQAAAKKAPAKRPAAKKAPAKQAPPKQAAGRKTPASKSPPRKTPAKKAPTGAAN